MTDREIFIAYIEPMMENAPVEAFTYFETIKNKKEKDKVEITELGYMILAAMQGNEDYKFTAKELGETITQMTGFEVTGRKASGGTRKLIGDGYIEKVEETNPPAYILTEKGKKVDINSSSSVE